MYYSTNVITIPFIRGVIVFDKVNDILKQIECTYYPHEILYRVVPKM